MGCCKTVILKILPLLFFSRHFSKKIAFPIFSSLLLSLHQPPTPYPTHHFFALLPLFSLLLFFLFLLFVLLGLPLLLLLFFLLTFTVDSWILFNLVCYNQLPQNDMFKMCIRSCSIPLLQPHPWLPTWLTARAEVSVVAYETLHHLSPVPLWSHLILLTAPVWSHGYSSNIPRMLRSSDPPAPLCGMFFLIIHLVLFLPHLQIFSQSHLARCVNI